MVTLDTLDDALAFRARIAKGQTVSRVAGPSGDWAMVDGALVNRAADYFRVVGRRTPTGERLLIRQPEPALVALVVTGPPGRRRVLLNARAEPGLSGGCQFSTTVQSTPANYERRHGGSETPFIDMVLHAGRGARILHDSIQYDWGQYYHLKSKRFRIVDVPTPVAATSPLSWVSAKILDDMLAHDQLVTVDLRAAAATLGILDAETESSGGVRVPLPPPPVGAHAGGYADLALEAGKSWTIHPRGIASLDGGRGVVWVRTRSTTREVGTWVQPLMVVPGRLSARLALRPGPSEPEAAVVAATQDGLDGHYLWYPAEPVGGRVVRHVEACAEGGRFLRHVLELEIVSGAEAPGATWLPLGVLEGLALAPLTTSVELRLLLGLARQDARMTP